MIQEVFLLCQTLSKNPGTVGTAVSFLLEPFLNSSVEASQHAENVVRAKADWYLSRLFANFLMQNYFLTVIDS